MDTREWGLRAPRVAVTTRLSRLAAQQRHRDQELSLTDRVSFALPRARKLRRAFAVDENFQALGFELVGPGDAPPSRRRPPRP